MRIPSLIRTSRGLVVALPLALFLLAAPALVAKGGGTWKQVAKKLKASAKAEAKADYNFALAKLYTLDPADRPAALDEAKEEYADAKETAGDQVEARLDLADELGETDLYRVEIVPSDFVTGIDNPFMPLVPGTTRNYEGDTEDGTETIVVTVLDETRVIMGVTCVVVRDTVYLDGVMIEDTHDWFAQDKLGNVWYFGEIALNYEGGRLVDVEGSWEAGVDGAQPGIVMPAVPAVGQIYRQEFLLGEAEDYARVEALGETVLVRGTTYTGCLRTHDGTPIEPDAPENKYYAPGVGVILELNPETGERVELIDVTMK